MSGGSMDYLYSKVEDANIWPTTPLRRAFIAHLKLVAEALHDIEWVQSSDCSAGTEEAAIRACLQPGAELAQIVSEARAVYEQLTEALRRDACLKS